jgi:RNA polymerase sigma-B factor
VSGTSSQSAVSRAERSRRTTELMLAAHETDDEALRARLLDEVIVLNRVVAEAVANRYRGRGVAVDDLHQSAYEGLVKAVHRFDPTVRPDLLTYAVPTIRGEVQRWFRDHSWMVRPPRRIQELQWHDRRSVERLTTDTGEPPTEEELSRDVGCSVEELKETVQAFGCFQPPSLDRPAGGAQPGMTVGELMVADDLEAFSAAEARVVLATVLPGLSERDRSILYLRFHEDLSQRDIGQRLGVTQMQISRVLERIFRTLRTQLAG